MRLRFPRGGEICGHVRHELQRILELVPRKDGLDRTTFRFRERDYLYIKKVIRA